MIPEDTLDTSSAYEKELRGVTERTGVSMDIGGVSPQEMGSRARYSMMSAVGTNPDYEAELSAVARRTGVPADTVRAFPDEMKKQDKLASFDFDKMAREFPNATKFLADQQKAGIAHDDTGSLTMLESMKNRAEFLGKSAHAGVLALTGAAATIANSIVGTSEADMAVLFKNDPKGLQDMLDNGAAGAPIRFARSQQQGSAIVMDGLSAGAKKQFQGLEYSNLEEGQSAWRSPTKILGDVLQSLPSSVAMGASVYLTKGAASSATAEALAAGMTPAAARAAGIIAAENMMVKVGAGSEGVLGYAAQYNSVREEADKVKDATVATSPAYQRLIAEGYDPKVARILVSADAADQAGVIAGIVDTAVNAVGGKFLGRFIGEGGKPLVAGAKAAGTEAITEGIQSPGEQFGENLAMRWHLNPKQDLSEGVVESMLQGIAVGGLSGGMMGAISARSSKDDASAEKAVKGADLMQEMIKTIQASKLMARSPEDMQTFMQSLVDEEGASNIYLDSAALVAAGVDLNVLSQSLPSIADQLENVKVGGDLVVPVSELLMGSIGSEFSGALIDNARTEVDGMSRAQAKVHMAEKGDAINAEIERVMTQIDNDAEFKSGRDEVHAKVLAQLNATGRYAPNESEQYANFMSSYFAVMAGRAGVTVTDFAKTYQLDIDNGEGMTAKRSQKMTQVTPKQAMATNVKLEMPAHADFQKAVKGTPGARVTPDGLLIDLKRNQKSSQDGAKAIRTGVFYLPQDDDETGGYDGGNDSMYGGPEEFNAPTLIRRPLLVEAATGGRAPVEAYKKLKGKAAALALEIDVLEVTSKKNATEDSKVDDAMNLLSKYGVNPDLAHDIVTHSTVGNTFTFALQEAIIAHAVREAGHDAVVGYTSKKSGAKFTEIFDVREQTFPSNEGDSEIHGDFAKHVWRDPASSRFFKDVDVRSKFLESNGIKPAAVYKGSVDQTRADQMTAAGLGPFMASEDRFELMDNPEFVEIAANFVADEKQASVGKILPKLVEKHRTDPATRTSAAESMAREIVKMQQQAKPRFDEQATEAAIDAQIKDAGLEKAFLDHVDAMVNPAGQTYNQAALPATVEIDGVQKSTTNSLGQKLANTEEGVKNFWKWFGNSKVVDADGRPMVTYHGTAKDFTQFKTFVSWGSTTKRLANDYAEMRAFGDSPAHVMPLYIRAENHFDASKFKNSVEISDFINEIKTQAEAAGRTMDEVELDLLERAIIKGSREEESGPTYSSHNFWNGISDLFGDKGAAAIKRVYEMAGFDSISLYEDGNLTYGVFKPSNLKSAIGNNGGFDSANANILYQTTIKDNNGSATTNPGAANQSGNGGGRDPRGSLAPLAGSPVIKGASGPDPRIVAVAEQYAADNGISLKRQDAYVQVDPERAARIAQAYEAMAHAPQDPAVAEAYANLIKQTMAQYKALEAAGYKMWFFDENTDPYAGNPWNAMRDMRANQSMAVFGTESGFGSGATELNVNDNPLLGETGLMWPYGAPDGPLKRVLANDLFRAVHDAFGHGMEGAGFRAEGEENAWQAHARLFTGSALAAITSETRGQNSWLNYGPHGENNRNAKVEDTVFADQKTGLLPSWTWAEGVAGDAKAETNTMYQSAALPDTVEIDGVQKPTTNSNGHQIAATEEGVRNFWKWFGYSKAVNAKGQPMVMYHGTQSTEITEFDASKTATQGQFAGVVYFTDNALEASSIYSDPSNGEHSGKNRSSESTIYPVYIKMSNPAYFGFEDRNKVQGKYVYSTTLSKIGAKSLKEALKGTLPAKDINEAIRNSTNEYDEFDLSTFHSMLGDVNFSHSTEKVAKFRLAFSKYLKEELRHDGIIQNADGFGQGVVESSDHYMVFESAKVKSAIGNNGEFDPENANILFQAEVEAPDLMVTHNLTEDNLLHAMKMGGLAAPSLAITKSDTPLETFGEIILIGDKSLIDPKGKGKPRVFGSDIFSPRYPKVERSTSDKGIDAIRESVRDLKSDMPFNIDIQKVRDYPRIFLAGVLAIKAKFLEDNGLTPKLAYDKASANERLVGRAMGEQLQEAGLESAFSDHIDALAASLYDGEVIQGIDENGRRTQVPHTLENVVNILKTDLRGGESNAGFGAGMLRSMISPEFKNLAQIKKAKGTLVSKEAFAEMKTTVDAQMYELEGLMGVKAQTLFAILVNSSTDGLEKAASDYGVTLSDKAEKKAKALIKELMTMPTEYFEAKILRAVQPAEFKGAIVPDNLGADALQYLADQGVTDIRTYTPGNTSERAERVAEFQHLFFQKNQAAEVARGQLAFANDITRQASVMTLLKNADFSTFIHESGHFFLEVQSDLATRIEAKKAAGETITDGEQSILDDMYKTLEWMGVEGSDYTTALMEWRLMPLESKRPYHEQFARGFEAYAFEGKAPSAELQKTFQMFRSWLVSVYKKLLKTMQAQKDPSNKDVAGALKVVLSDEVRGVMDRMLATGEQISQAEHARGMTPLFNSPIDAGMTDDEFREYIAQSTQAALDAIDIAMSDSLKDMQWLNGAKSRRLKEMQAEHKALRAETSALVREELLHQDVYKVWNYLTMKGEGGVRFKTQAMREIYGAEPDALWRKLSDLGMTSDAKGIHPDEVADMFIDADGNHLFGSGDELVQKIAASEKLDDAVARVTDERMLAAHGEMATPEGIARAADKAAHNDARARFLATELRALQKKEQKEQESLKNKQDADKEKKDEAAATKATKAAANAALAVSTPEPPKTGDVKAPASNLDVGVLVKATKTYATRLIGGLKVKNIRPGQYTAAETRAAHAAVTAKTLSEQVQFKRDQLINMYLAKAAHDGLAEVEKMRQYFKAFDRHIPGVARDYQEQIHQLLEKFDLRVATTLTTIEKRKSLAAWYAEQEKKDGANLPDIPEHILEAAQLTSYKDMTLNEMRDLQKTIIQLEHIGRLKGKMLLARDARDFDDIANDAAGQIIKHGGKAKPVPIEDLNPIRKGILTFLAQQRKFASLIRQMDGSKDNGIMYKLLGRSLNDRALMADIKTEEAAEKLQKLYEPLLSLKGGLYGNASKVYIKAVDLSLTRGGRIAIALNWGNALNRQRVTAGDGWSEAQVQAILKTLTPVELDFVNKTWEYLDGFWPEIEAKQLRLTGIKLEKIEAEPFELTAADGTVVQMRGGYYPKKYDPNHSNMEDQRRADELGKSMSRGAVSKATTKRGFIKTSKEEVNERVRKDLNVITEHITEINHDLALHEWMIDANRLLSDERVIDAIRTHYGGAVLKTMKDALMGIAGADMQVMTQGNNYALKVRANVARATMGFSLTTAFLQPFGMTQSMARIGNGNALMGAKYVLQGAARWGGDAVRMENTLTWIHGKSDFMRLRAKTFNKELREVNNAVLGKSETMKMIDASMFMLMQKMQMIADVPTWIGQYEKSLKEGLDEDAAVAMADRIVVESQGGGSTKDLTESQRKNPFLSMFYSYFSVTMNLTIESTARTDFKNPKAVAGWLGDMMLLNVIPAILPSLLMYALKGGLEGDENEPEDWLKRVAKWQLGYLFGMVMYVREFSGIASGFEYTGPPAGRIVIDSGKFATQAAQGEIDEPAIVSMVALLGSVLGIPSVQLLRSYKGWKAWDEGQEGAGPQSVLFGPPPRD